MREVIRFIHIWPYKTLEERAKQDDRRRCSAATRRTGLHRNAAVRHISQHWEAVLGHTRTSQPHS